MKSISNKTFALLLLSLVYGWLFSGLAWATSASISVSGNEGAIPLTASASFTSYEHCDSQDPPDCWNVDSGSLNVYHNGGHIGGASGNGSASWSTTLDGGAMSQGDHTFEAVASDSQGDSDTATQTIAIDNTPVVNVNNPGQVEGAFDITGSATFKEHVNGVEGRVELDIDGAYQGIKYYEGTGVSWSYSEITGNMLDAGAWPQGDHTVDVYATANNGTRSPIASSAFTIDNTPDVTVNNPGQVEGSFDITGSATFKEHVNGVEGRVELDIDGAYQGIKYYEGTGVSWSYSEITGNMLDAGAWPQGDHTVDVYATANNGTRSPIASATFSIDNTPVVHINNPGQVEGAFDITGSVAFKEHVNGVEGSVAIYIDDGYQGTKSYEGTSVSWSYSEIAGGMLDAGSWGQGPHRVDVYAYANNGAASPDASATFSIDNTPDVNVNNPGQVEGAFDITGSVAFKEHVNGTEGSVAIYIDDGYQGTKSYEGTTVSWSYSDIAGNMLDAGSWGQGPHRVDVYAYANNGAASPVAIGSFEVAILLDDKNTGSSGGSCEIRPFTTGPINFSTGNKFKSQQDLTISGPGLPFINPAIE